jgi:X-X-X-Leu-X-X-Gly heptad repeat protein
MKLKRTIVSVVMILMLSIWLGIPATAKSDIPTYNEVIKSGVITTREAAAKNETVYGMLNYDGSVNDIYVVNQLIGTYTDYGSYSEIKNLTTSSTPEINDDKITFSDEYVDGGLFYQGKMDAPLPMVFDITYRLDGKEISADNLAGQHGHLEITVNYDVNKACDEHIRDGLMTQITMTLGTDKADNVSAPGATKVLAGSTLQVAFMALPGESGTAMVQADVTDFEMDAVSITLIKGMPSIGAVEESIDGIKDGFNELYDGAGSMVDGTTELKDGMKSLRSGMGDLSDGLSRLSGAGHGIGDGLDELSHNLAVFADGIDDAANGSAEMQTGIRDLAAGGSSMADGVSGISDGLSGLSASGAELKTLAQSLLTSPDPSVQALAQGVLETLGTVDALSSGLHQASQGAADYAAGVQQMADQYTAFHDGIEASAAAANQIAGGCNSLSQGFDEFSDGLHSSADGAYRLYEGIRGLPGNVQELIDGQIDFQDGIAEARDEIAEQTEGLTNEDTRPVSFASPDKNMPDSVQYILTTPAIKVTKITNEQTDTEKEENFFTRLADLFVAK